MKKLLALSLVVLASICLISSPAIAAHKAKHKNHVAKKHKSKSKKPAESRDTSGMTLQSFLIDESKIQNIEIK